MNSAEQKTAKIYTFPMRPRVPSSAERLASLEQNARPYGQIEFGSGWYHDNAIAKVGDEPKR